MKYPFLIHLLKKGKVLVVTGETGDYDITGARVEENFIVELLGVEK